MKKKTILTLGISALLLTAVIGTTLALMSAKTEDKTNVFSVGSGITGELKEPLWDGDNFTKEENQVTIPEEAKLGENIAKNYYPNSEIPKDPAIANTSTVDTWVAVTIDYAYYDRTVVKNNDGTETVSISEKKNSDITGMTMFIDKSTKFATVDFNSEQWAFNDDYTVAYYKVVVPAGTKTGTVFNTVSIEKGADLTNATDTSKMLGISKFEINLQGYLVQALGVDDFNAAKTELYKLIQEAKE